MKKIPLLFLLCFIFSANAQSDNPKFDQKLADALGADDYGMKSYMLVILKTGSNNEVDKNKLKTLFNGHLANIQQLASQGLLVVAGPMGKNEKNYRGIFILNVKTAAAAQLLLESDPAIKEKVLEAEIYNWYGSAALPEYLKVHEQIERKKP